MPAGLIVAGSAWNGHRSDNREKELDDDPDFSQPQLGGQRKGVQRPGNGPHFRPALLR